MTIKLLVSVRNGIEAEVAFAGGADVIDVKEPSRGSLGAASSESISEVIRAIDGRCPISVAMGELHEQDRSMTKAIPFEFLSHYSVPHGVIRFAKIGLAHMAHRDWQAAWSDWADRVQRTADPIAVCYLDWQAAGAPSPCDIIAHAAGQQVTGVLFDTHNKQLGSSLTRWRDELCAAVAQLQPWQWFALAGSVSLSELDAAKRTGARLIAVRGAACGQGRESAIELDAVRKFAEQLHADA
ncbi:MAG: (5-formylfuran-3-yl)methyl phosphate synthase [Pirellulaceae bacterium]|nr:hypothetical protein [Planctomycetales bacterium]